jgi:Transposase DDE domain.
VLKEPYVKKPIGILMSVKFSYQRLQSRPRNFHRIAGVSIEKFEGIVLKCEREWEKKIIKPKKLDGRPYGVGNLKEHLLTLLIYYRCYTTQEFIGMLYGVDDSCVCRSIQRIEPIVAKVIAIKKDRTLTQKDLETIIIDCTEQPIERPKKRQKRYYSGKKKQHTLKTEIQITEGGRIVSTSKSHPGKDHDFEIRKRGSPLSGHSRAYGDSGYQGLDKLHKATEIPYRKPKNGELTPEEKEYNGCLSRFRVRVENKIRELKIFRIICERYRNKRKRYGLKFNIVAGIVNFKNGF